MSFNVSMLSACAIDVSAVHLHPDLVGDACISDLSIAGVSVHHHSPAFATLNSSTADDRGSCNCPDLMYSPTDVKPGK